MTTNRTANRKARRNQRDAELLLFSRGSQLMFGFPLLLFGLWGLWSCAQFLHEAKEYEAIEWIVFLVLNELFAGVTFAAITLLTCAAFDPPWLRWILLQSIHHLNWMLGLIAICFLGGMLLLLLAIPVIVFLA